MSMRTYEYFACPNGHQGVEKLRERPALLKKLRAVSAKGMRDGPDGVYTCTVCGWPMSRVPKSQS